MARRPQRLLAPLWRWLQPLELELGLAPVGRLVVGLVAGLAPGAQLVAICSSGSAVTAVSCRSCPVTPA